MGLIEKIAKVAVTAAVAKGAATVVSMIGEDMKRNANGGRSPYENEYEIISESGRNNESFLPTDMNSASAANRPAFCPYCGGPINSSVSKCPYYDSELPEAPDSCSVQDLMDRLSAIDSQQLVWKQKNKTALEDAVGSFTGRNEREEMERDETVRRFEESKEQQKKTLIQKYPIPGSRKGLLEFMDYIVNNIDLEDRFLSATDQLWIDKMEQVYQKAQYSIKGSEQYTVIQTLYNSKKREIEHFEERLRIQEEEQKAKERRMFLYLGIMLFVMLTFLGLMNN